MQPSTLVCHTWAHTSTRLEQVTGKAPTLPPEDLQSGGRMRAGSSTESARFPLTSKRHTLISSRPGRHISMSTVTRTENSDKEDGVKGKFVRFDDLIDHILMTRWWCWWEEIIQEQASKAEGFPRSTLCLWYRAEWSCCRVSEPELSTPWTA